MSYRSNRNRKKAGRAMQSRAEHELNLNKAAIRQDGFNEDEIAWLEQHLAGEKRRGSFDQQAELVVSWGRHALVCRSVAALERLRPGVWLSRPGANPAETSALARRIWAYLRERAKAEGLRFDQPDEGLIHLVLRAGGNPIDGVHHDGRKMLRDDQEPREGFFKTHAPNG
jgi:hypothetical protein